jgi:hypothetical protein
VCPAIDIDVCSSIIIIAKMGNNTNAFVNRMKIWFSYTMEWLRAIKMSS